jgi:nicotinate-nucleotide adenylyltransferase
VKIGVLGGTFDPVHTGHLVLAETAREQLALDRVLFVPAGQPWRKAGRQIAPAADRVAMIRLAIEGNPAFEVSTVEMDRRGPSYTADTLRHLQSGLPEARLFFLLGGDALLDLPNWREPDVIRKLATLVVAVREREAPPAEPGVIALAMPRIEISATAIRERVRSGLSIRYLAPEGVERYIREHGLYVG